MEAALKNKKETYEILDKLKDDNIEFINIDWLNPEGMMSDFAHAEKVADFFLANKVDAVFVPHCNFGCEEAVGKLAHLIQKPVLLWGPRDEKIGDEGSRATDTQCGLFASSRLLMRYGVPYTYIENCWITDKQFAAGLEKFFSVVSVVKTFKSLRIGQINSRPKYFTSVMYNESELLEKFGIEVVPINIAMVKEKMDEILKEKKFDINSTSADICQRIDCSSATKEYPERLAALKMAYVELAETHKCNALANECWTIMPQILGVLPCLAMAELGDAGLPVSCETDVNGIISSMMLSAAARGKTPSFFGEFTMRHPDDDNTELIWHCGPYPYSLKKPDVKARIIQERPNWEIIGGDLTIACFGSNRGQYSMLAGHALGVDGPETKGTYVWAKVNDWVKWERKFIEGPYIHHVSGIHGKYAGVLKEACKYIPELKFDSMEEI